MLIGIAYFTFGPVRDYVAGSRQTDPEPPPLASFATDDANAKKTPVASATAENQDSIVAGTKVTTEVPTAYRKTAENETGVNEKEPEPVDKQDPPQDQGQLAGQPADAQSGSMEAGMQQKIAKANPPAAGGGSSTKDKAASAVETEAAPPLASGEGEKPVMVTEAQQVVIFFDHDSHILPAEAAAKLSRMVGAAFRSPDALISIMGYTDSLGNEWYNRKLSQTRANMVRDFFLERGIQPAKIKAVGKGAVNPLASNDTADGRRKNRRVEIFIGSAVN
jgi:outer membrane protein OmpA-like peptidoglycan-associated protein